MDADFDAECMLLNIKWHRICCHHKHKIFPALNLLWDQKIKKKKKNQNYNIFPKKRIRSLILTFIIVQNDKFPTTEGKKKTTYNGTDFIFSLTNEWK